VRKLFFMDFENLDLRALRKKKNLRQDELAERLGVHRNTVVNYERDSKLIPDSKIALIKAIFSDEAVGAGKANDLKKVIGNAKINSDLFIELEYIPVKARAGFAELEQIVSSINQESFRVLKIEGESLVGQVVIEIDGDSMEPIYTSGSRVRAKEVDAGDWIYLNSGVYAVVYSNFFVVKRVKNSPANGVLTLHSDNTETGGTTDVPLSEVRKIWKVMRIVDAPAR
jgi:phage repressor protein C with HTH and peptisase S24 domain